MRSSRPKNVQTRHDHHDGRQRSQREEDERGSERVLEQRVDPLAVTLEALGVVELLLDDLAEAVALLDRHARGRREGRARIERAQLDVLTRGHVDGTQERVRSRDRHIAAHPDRMTPRADDVPGPGHRRREPSQALLPLVAPDLEIHVDDVVVADGQPAQAVADRERPCLVRRLVAPDDPGTLVEVADAVRSRRAAGLELCRRSRLEGLAALRDAEHLDALAVPQGDLAEPVGEAEVAEREGDVLLDRDGAVREDVRADVRRGQVVGLRKDRRRERERGQRGRRSDEQLAGQRAKSTRGGSRCASSSTSKNSRAVKPNGPAKTTPGNVWIALLYVSTVSL